MHSLLSRLNALFAFTITVTGVLAVGLYLTTFTYTQDGNVSLGTTRLAVKHMTEYGNAKKRNDLGFLSFDLKTDLSPLFNWNVKQLFLYLTAEYETKQNTNHCKMTFKKLNQVVLWDKIVLKGENYKLDMKNAKTKYQFWDDGDGLKANKNVTLYLTWNIIPNVGALPNVISNGKHKFSFPKDYASSM